MLNYWQEVKNAKMGIQNCSYLVFYWRYFLGVTRQNFLLWGICHSCDPLSRLWWFEEREIIMPQKIRKHRLLFQNFYPTDEQIIDKMEEEIGAIEQMEWKTELDVTSTPRVLGGCCGSDGQMRIIVILATYVEAR